jgi:hypothetical protein
MITSPMKNPGNTAVCIAGSKTVDDWNTFRPTLVVGGNAEPWREAFGDYFHARVFLRYLNPIRTLQENGTFEGEGFSIVAIQCTLIEFLESTIQGRLYRYRRLSDPPLAPHEYSNSSDLFISFLTTRQPFAKDFSPQLAREFYEGVRCGLLHEARTKNGWTIWAKSPTGQVVSAAPNIVYRDNFQTALLDLIKWYRGALSADRVVQEAFIRKFDSLCR